MNTKIKIAGVALALALASGTASADWMNGGRSGFVDTIHWEITHNFGSSSQVKSLLITLNDPSTGEVNPLFTIFSVPTPVVTIDTVGGLARAVENTEVLALPGGGSAVRWTFADSNLWVQGEKLVFTFDADLVSPTIGYIVGEDYTFVPAPGAAAAFAGLGLLGASRRRR